MAVVSSAVPTPHLRCSGCTCSIETSPKFGVEVQPERCADTQPTTWRSTSATKAVQPSSGGGSAIIFRVDSTPRTRYG